MTDDRMRELFREMRDEPVPPDSLARVRMKVAERTAAPAGRWAWWWRVAIGAALVAVLVVAVMWRRPAPSPARVEVARIAPPVAPQPKVVETRVIPDRPKPRPAIRHAAVKRNAPGGAVAIRIETPDPDVVIILLGEEGPGD